MFYPVSKKNPGLFTVTDLGLSCEAESLDKALDILAEKADDFVEETFRKQGKPVPMREFPAVSYSRRQEAR